MIWATRDVPRDGDEIKKVYCKDCKHYCLNCLNDCLKVVGMIDTPVKKVQVFACSRYQNRYNNCKHYEKRSWWRSARICYDND